MPQIYLIDKKQFKIGVWEISETEEQLLKGLFLTEDEQNIFKRIKSPLKRKQWLSYRNLIQELLENNNYKGIFYDEAGKPFLNELPYHISVSHTENYSAAIISNTIAVGVDIEPIKDKILRVEKKFISDFEISLLPEQNRNKALHIIWGAKEAVYKLKGEKEVFFAEDLHIQSISDKEKDVLKCIYQKNNIKETYLIHYEIFRHLMLVYAM